MKEKLKFKLPDRLTFKRAEVTRLTKLDGRVLDYWEREFGSFKTIVNKMGEQFYSRRDVEVILTIKHFLIEKQIDKRKIKKMLHEDGHAENPQKPLPEKPKEGSAQARTLKKIKKELKEILTILNKNSIN